MYTKYDLEEEHRRFQEEERAKKQRQRERNDRIFNAWQAFYHGDKSDLNRAVREGLF